MRIGILALGGLRAADGISEVLKLHIQHLRKRENELVLFSSNPLSLQKRSARAFSEGAILTTADIGSPLSWLKLIKTVKQSDVDVLYGVGSAFVGVILGILTKLTGVPSVLYLLIPYDETLWYRSSILRQLFHGVGIHNIARDLLSQGRFLDWGLRNISHLIVNSNYVKWSLPLPYRNDAELLYQCVRKDFFLISPEPHLKDLIVYFGECNKARGIYDILTAYADFRVDKGRGRLLLAISSRNLPCESLCKKIIAERSIQKDVTWKGYTNMNELLCQATIVALPNRVYNVSQSVIETMAAARPVIATRTGWIPELVDDEVNGFTIDVGDVETMKKRITELIEDHQLALEIGKLARTHAKKLCDPDQAAKRLEQIFRLKQR